ncbi:MAG: HAMP domain-containing histidine kinase [Methylotenera sp.]|nr:HAMP domain-containing histidine kinase [Oligoflexia bacterium]
MKKFITWIVLSLVFSICVMVGIHWFSNQETQKKIVHMNSLSQRQKVAGDLILELERYRRLNGAFKKMSDRDIATAKTHLKTQLGDGISQLERLDTTEEETVIGRKVLDQTAELLLMSAKLEPTLFTKDVYQKEPIRTIHDHILASLTQLRENAASRAALIQPQTRKSAAQSLQGLLIIAALAVLFVGLMLIRQYYVSFRPTRKLREYLGEIRNGKGIGQKRPKLSGVYAEIEETLFQLCSTVDAQRRDRQQFLTAVSSDLRSPIMSLQAASNFLVGSNDSPSGNGMGSGTGEARRIQAANTVKRSLYRLNKTLEDLTDIIDVDRPEIRLEETIVDMTETLERVGGLLSGVDSLHPISVAVPDSPIWALVDAKRVERVMITLISKLMVHRPQGGRIDVSIHKASATGASAFRGVEIHIQDGGTLNSSMNSHFEGREGSRADSRMKSTAGPEQDVLKHWIRENGFGMTLAQKIMKAHGGYINAAGLTGTSVHFIVRLPEDRISNLMDAGTDTSRLQMEMSENLQITGSREFRA